MVVRQAVILVGGKGTRLGAHTAATPKPLLEIDRGFRFLDVLLGEAARQGFEDIILLAGHLGDQVEAHYAGARVRGATVRVLREGEPAGTGGALSQAGHLLDPLFVMTNGDSWFDINLRALAAKPLGSSLGRLALRATPDASRYGSVSFDGSRITEFREKDPTAPAAGLISGGVYLLSRDVLETMPQRCSIEIDVFPALARERRLEGSLCDGYFIDIGLPETLAEARRDVLPRLTRGAVFLDRDGVLNHDDGYTHRPEDLRWKPGAREAVRAINDAGRYAIVVTNQAGVARNLYSEEQVTRFHARMQDELAEAGAHVDAFYTCPFHPDAQLEAYRHADHPDRKPNPGMILRAFAEWPIHRESSFLVGDRPTDIEAARRAGLPGFLYAGGNLHALIEPLLGESRWASSGP